MWWQPHTGKLLFWKPVSHRCFERFPKAISQSRPTLPQVSRSKIGTIFTWAIRRTTWWRWLFFCRVIVTLGFLILSLYSLVKMHKLGAYKEIQNVMWPYNYSFKLKLHDVALLELKSKFQWTSTVKPACLPHPIDSLPPTFPDRAYEGPLMVSARRLFTMIVWYDLALDDEQVD